MVIVIAASSVSDAEVLFSVSDASAKNPPLALSIVFKKSVVE